MTWRCAVEDEFLGHGVQIALANMREHGSYALCFEPVTTVDYEPGWQLPENARLLLPRDAAVALMLELQKHLAPDKRSVDREVLERTDEALAVERARVDKILDRDSRVIITNGLKNGLVE